jgi:hypothetical protein
LGADWLNPAIRMIQSLGNLDRTTRKNMGKVLGVLFEAVKNNINTLLPAPEKTPPNLPQHDSTEIRERRRA